MAVGGHFVNQPIEILTRQEVKRIYEGAIEVLETTGATIEHGGALEILDGAGCSVDHKTKRVRFPSYLIEECLRKCPGSFSVRGRNPAYDIRLGDPRVYFTNRTAMSLADVDTGDQRVQTRQDFMDAVRVLDALDEVQFVFPPCFELRDVPPALYYNTLAALLLRSTEKPTWAGMLQGSEIFSMKMWQVTGSRPLVHVMVTDPLAMAEDQVDGLIRSAEAGFPILVLPGPSIGATAPATLAGTLVLTCAENMIGIVLAQIAKPGIGVMVGQYDHPMDMRLGTICSGGVERILTSVASSHFWRELGIPHKTAASSDSKLPDYQCAMEKVMSATVHALAGSNLVMFIGSVYDELTFSPELAIIDNEAAHMVARFLEGIKVTEETLAVGVINEVGPVPGHYLSTPHTRKWVREELFVPSIIDRLAPAEWIKTGRKNAMQKAKERMEEILATHEASPLPEDQEKAIDEILKEARAYYEHRDML